MRTLKISAFCGCLGVGLALASVPIHRYSYSRVLNTSTVEPIKLSLPKPVAVQSRRQEVVKRLRQLPPMVFIWQPKRCIGHGPFLRLPNFRPDRSYQELLAEEAAQAHVTVLLKVHDGDERFKRFDAKFFHALVKRKVPIIVWGNTYVTDEVKEAKVIWQFLKQPGVIGYVADVEKESGNRQEGVRLTLRQVKEWRDRKCPAKLIGYTSYPIPQLHPEIGYSRLNDICDFAMPQLYVQDMGWDLGVAWDQCLGQMADKPKIYLDAPRCSSIPLVPIGQAYGPITLEEQSQFVRLARSQANFCFYSWQQMRPATWQLISRPQPRSKATILAAARLK